MNDELVAVSERISELKAEERTLLVETEKAESLAAVESYAVGTLGMELPRLDQRNTGASELSDRATVLHARRGQAPAVFLGEPSRHGYGMFLIPARYNASE